MPCLFWQSRFLFLAASALSVVSLSKFVDDADSSISYSPSTAWTQGATCGVDCAIQPDASLTHDGTWHYATYDPTEDIVAPSIAFSFTATGIVVRNILPPSVPTALTSRVELAFELDGVAQQSFSYRPSRNVSFIYDAVVMSATNLSLAEHTLIIQIPPSQAAVVLFDYFELTVPDQGEMEIPQPPSSSQPASSTSLAAPTLTAVVTVTSTQLSPDKMIATSSSTSPPTSSSTASASQTSGILSHTQPSALAVSSSDLQLSQDTSSTVTASAAVPETLGIAAASSTASPSQSQTAAPMARSTTRSATIGGAVGGGALLIILCVAFCVFRTRCANRRRGIAGDEALQRDCAAVADGGVESSEETREQHHGPAFIYRSPDHEFSDDPFVHGNEHLGLLASGTVSSGDITSTGGGATNTSDLFGEAMVARHPLPISLYGTSLQPQTSLEGWDKDDKSRTAAVNPLSHSPALEDTQFPSLPQAENTQHLGTRWSPRPLEENFAEQLATLREEVAQMRRHREAASPLEAPPRYGEL
ncbi:uncharacterized protein TRAVEDRAFT_54095 [Trametes versicolor FP-101664 SS1]|uniref:Transmembrane protein n=1 Tax=Trametes versicolor (strain FP-101664) TaxID=717944 RepID=R7S902_TRAVS|nr:uncharacterized protein TRAVEDRAFT_54095 [Trametes versicolor FP-101664 SS1]EIW52122.1 hypothetical protein TRAVEDRAFT_54095 [Trametes versicolor FP-101664 SS1]